MSDQIDKKRRITIDVYWVDLYVDHDGHRATLHCIHRTPVHNKDKCTVVVVFDRPLFTRRPSNEMCELLAIRRLRFPSSCWISIAHTPNATNYYTVPASGIEIREDLRDHPVRVRTATISVQYQHSVHPDEPAGDPIGIAVSFSVWGETRVSERVIVSSSVDNDITTAFSEFDPVVIFGNRLVASLREGYPALGTMIRDSCKWTLRCDLTRKAATVLPRNCSSFRAIFRQIANEEYTIGDLRGHVLEVDRVLDHLGIYQTSHLMSRICHASLRHALNHSTVCLVDHMISYGLSEYQFSKLASVTTNPEFLSGAIVLETRPGVYMASDRQTVFELDFASMYPSILIATKQCVTDASGSDAAILPGIVQRLVDLRAEFKTRGDEYGQRAAKISANSVYGTLGSPMSVFYNPRVASAITAKGREIISQAAKMAGVYENMTVVAGDTDSIFVAYTGDNADDASLELAREITNSIKLDGVYIKREAVFDVFIVSREKKQALYFIGGVLHATGMPLCYAPSSHSAVEAMFIEAAAKIVIEKGCTPGDLETLASSVLTRALEEGIHNFVITEVIGKPVSQYKIPSMAVRAVANIPNIQSGACIEYIRTVEGPVCTNMRTPARAISQKNIDVYWYQSKLQQRVEWFAAALTRTVVPRAVKRPAAKAATRRHSAADLIAGASLWSSMPPVVSCFTCLSCSVVTTPDNPCGACGAILSLSSHDASAEAVRILAKSTSVYTEKPEDTTDAEAGFRSLCAASASWEVGVWLSSELSSLLEIDLVGRNMKRLDIEW